MCLFQQPQHLSLRPAYFLVSPSFIPSFQYQCFLCWTTGQPETSLSHSLWVPQVKDLYHLRDSEVCKWWACALTDCCPLLKSSWWRGGHVVQLLLLFFFNQACVMCVTLRSPNSTSIVSLFNEVLCDLINFVTLTCFVSVPFQLFALNISVSHWFCPSIPTGLYRTGLAGYVGFQQNRNIKGELAQASMFVFLKGTTALTGFLGWRSVHRGGCGAFSLT